MSYFIIEQVFFFLRPRSFVGASQGSGNPKTTKDMQNQEIGGAKALLLLTKEHQDLALGESPLGKLAELRPSNKEKSASHTSHTSDDDRHNVQSDVNPAHSHNRDECRIQDEIPIIQSRRSRRFENGSLAHHENNENGSQSDGLNHDPAHIENREQIHEQNHENEGELFDKENQQLTDVVEAAVMQYVGSALADDDPQNSHALTKRRGSDDLMSEYHWDRFFEQDEVFERAPRKCAEKSFMGGSDIDPELADLNATTDHDLLVSAAIMSAGDLAKELLITEGQKLHSMFDSRSNTIGLGGLDSGSSLAALNGTLNDIGSSNITSGAPNASSKIGPAIGVKGRVAATRKRTGKATSQQLDFMYGFNKRQRYKAQNIDALVKEAAEEANMWLSTQSNVGTCGPRLFSPQEIAIVDNFIQGYCQLNNLNRAQICERVWAVHKPKDNFWEHLSRVLPYRSRASVYKHVRRQYHVFTVRAKWTKEEDSQLMKHVEQSNANWRRIGEAMNRMPEDCRDRWRNYLKCGDNRSKNQWSEDEENMLKGIILDMHASQAAAEKALTINWTLVSEKMNGARSRIQCRYKWNKLVKRDLVVRIAAMGLLTKIWLLNRLLHANVHNLGAINWEYLAQSYYSEHKQEKDKSTWSASDFKVAFERLHNSVRDHKNLPLHSVITKLLGIIYVTPGSEDDQSMAAVLRPKEINAAECDSTSVANAAVAAASSVGHDFQHQEYSLWR